MYRSLVIEKSWGLNPRWSHWLDLVQSRLIGWVNGVYFTFRGRVEVREYAVVTIRRGRIVSYTPPAAWRVAWVTGRVDQVSSQWYVANTEADQRAVRLTWPSDGELG
jgi:hypothetical protein